MNLSHAIIALALFVPQKQDKQHPPAPVSKAMRISCTPNSLAFDGGIPQESRNAIASALTLAAPGAVIDLGPGDYHSFDIGNASASGRTARTSGGNRAHPITVDGHGQVRIDCGSEGIKIAQEIANAFITFKNLEFRAANGSAITFMDGEGWVHEGYQFIDCSIVGGWDHELKKGGGASKCGLWASELKDFKFVGRGTRAAIHDFKLEHAFSLKNLRGDVWIENVAASRLGGAFVRLASDESASYSKDSSLTVSNCTAEACCLGDGDDRGGAAVFTVEGRYDGRVELRGDTFRAGTLATSAGGPLSKAASQRGILLDWSGAEETSGGKLILIDNHFESVAVGPRPMVAIAGCTSLELRNLNRLVGALDGVALELEPVGRGGESAPIGKLSIDPSTAMDGSIRWRGTQVTRDELLTKYPRADPSSK